jgi:hypothetical protein
VIYDDMTASDFPNLAPWHEQLFNRLKTWTYDSDTTCDLTRSEYQSIFVVDASGLDAVRLYPHWDVLPSRRSERIPKILPNGVGTAKDQATVAMKFL